MNLSVKIGSLTLRNPVMVASGTFGFGVEYAEIVDLNQLGAIVVKGIRSVPVHGNPPPRTFELPWGLLNSIGLQGPGVDGFLHEYLPALRAYDVPIIVNVWGVTVEEYAEVCARLDSVDGVAAIELNVSCPNVKVGGAQFGATLGTLKEVVRASRQNTRLPLIVKLSPNVPSIEDYALAAEEAGADAISIANSFPAMAIDVRTGFPRLGNITGGLTGPCVKPMVLKLVWDATRAVRIPVIGVGGIQSANDAIEYLMAGATAVAIGTANFYEPQTAIRIVHGIAQYLAEHDYNDVYQLIGLTRRLIDKTR